MNKKAQFSKLALLSTALIALLVVVSVAAASLNLDNFNGGTFAGGGNTLTASSGSPNVFNTNDGTGFALGDERDVEANWLSGAGQIHVRIDFADNNRLEYIQGPPNVSGNATITWDGADGAAALDPDGLCTQVGCAASSGVDLTSGGSIDGFQIELTSNDFSIPLILRVYSGNAANYKVTTITPPSDITAGTNVDIFVRFTDFTDVGTGASFSNVGAIQLVFSGDSLNAAKIWVDFFDVDNWRDYGDLPNAGPDYSAVLGASHIANGLRLGSNIDIEAAAVPNASANGDDSDQSPDDEDGVQPTPGFSWSDTAGGSVDVVVNGCPGTCYLNGWIDWSQDGDFADTGEYVLADQSVSNGNSTLTFSIPTGMVIASSSFFSRFRLCPNASECNATSTADVFNGELEDYQWSFGPTAVTLTSLNSSRKTLPVSALAGAIILSIATLLLVFFIRKRKKTI